MTVKPREVIVVEEGVDERIGRRTRELAKRLRLRMLEANDLGSQALILAVRDDGLELRDQQTRPGRGMRADFSTVHRANAIHRRMTSKNQPLGRAIGRDADLVLDATAGLGQDSALLVAMGFRVVAVERSPILAALLRDGFERAVADPELAASLVDRLTIVEGDARRVLDRGEHRPDVVYIDPMFPPKRRTSALAKKCIRLVREIVGDDDDAGELLETARRDTRRVVVKRPRYAPPLAEPVTAQITSKLVRYDIYVQPPPPV